jgi:hypothetical protein
MRRRTGAPSNHFEAAGASAGQTHPTLDDHYNMAQSAESSRVAIGEGPIDTPHETMSAEQDAPATTSGSGFDRNGATYRVSTAATHLADPTVGPTIAKGRIVTGNFRDELNTLGF